MNVENGAMEFEGTMDNSNLDKALEQSAKKVQGFQEKVEKSGKSIDNLSDITKENVTIQKRVIADLEKQWSDLNKQIGKVPPGNARAELERQAKSLKEEIIAEKNALYELEDALNSNDQASTSLRRRISQLTQALAEMERNGERGTHQYNVMRDELASLADQMGDTRQQMRVLSSDTANFDGAISGLNGLVGGFAAAQGAIGLFAGENENLQKIMTKVQSLMAITMGLQQLSNALNKDSAFMLVTVNKAKEVWNTITGKSIAAQTAETVSEKANTAAKKAGTAATVGSTAAQTAETAAAGVGTVANWSLAASFRAVSAAIKSIPVFGWILAGISAIVGLVTMFTDSEDENTKAIKENEKALKDQEEQLSLNDRIMKSVADSTQEEKSKIEILTGIIRDNAQANDVRKKAIGRLMKIIPGYTAQLDSEGRLTRENKKAVDDYIDALDRMAMAKAVQSELEKLNQKELAERLKQTKAQKAADDNKWAEDRDKQRQEEYNDPNVARSDATRVVTPGTRQMEADATAAQALREKALKEVSDAKEAIAKIKKDKDELFKIIKDDNLSEAFVEESKYTDGDGDKQVKTFKNTLEEIKSLYTEYNKWRNSSDEQVREAAKTEFADLVKQGATYMDYLVAQRDKLIAAGTNTADVQSKLKDLNDAIADATKENVLTQFTESLRDQLNAADNIMEKLDIIAAKRKTLAGDGSELDKDEEKVLNQAEEDAREKLNDQQESLLSEYAAYNDKRLQMEKEYSANLRMLEAARDSATSDAEKEKIQAAIENYQRAMNEALKTSGDPKYDEMIEEYKTFEQRKADIAVEFDEKRRIARIHGDEAMIEELNKQEQTAQTKNAFDALKANPDYIKAFDDLKSVSDQTLTSLLERFDEVKEAAARDLDPSDFKEYMSRIDAIVSEMNTRNPFAGLVKAYGDLKTAALAVKTAEEKLKKAEKESGKGSREHADAERELKAAQDKHAKATKNVRNAEKETKGQVDKLCKALAEVGDAVGGEAGKIISLIGDIGSFVMNTVDSFKVVTGATAQAMSTMEKASVILTVISAAFQLAQKLSTLFGDGGEADYQRASEVYKEYISVMDDVIDKQKELMDVMSGEAAKEAFKTAKRLIQEQADAARTLGKQYLNAGASSGFLGIGSSASHGVDQRKNMSDEAWAQLRKLYQQGVIDVNEWSNIANGRMTGLFDLSASQLRKVMEEAPVFWANLAEDTRTYLKQIIACEDKTQELADAMKESLTGVSFDSVEDEFRSLMEDMDADSKDFAKNMSEYLRKSLINQLFKSQFKDQLKKWYDMWADAMDPDGEGGSTITTEEQKALDTLRDSIVNGASAAAKQINDQFKTEEDLEAESGSIQSVTEETAGKIEGQMQAIRINQMEMLEHIRGAIQYLAIISTNSGYLVHLKKIDQILAKMDGNSDARRGQGIA